MGKDPATQGRLDELENESSHLHLGRVGKPRFRGARIDAFDAGSSVLKYIFQDDF